MTAVIAGSIAHAAPIYAAPNTGKHRVGYMDGKCQECISVAPASVAVATSKSAHPIQSVGPNQNCAFSLHPPGDFSLMVPVCSLVI